MVVTTPRVAAAVAQNDLEQVRPVSDHSRQQLDLHGARHFAAAFVDSVARQWQMLHNAFVLQVSRTTAQGLWLAIGCGVIVGVAIYVGGPSAVAGSVLPHAHATCVPCCGLQHVQEGSVQSVLSVCPRQSFAAR